MKLVVKQMKKNNYFFYRVVRIIMSPLFRLYYNPKITGKENIPLDGSILITSNHKHIMDQCPAILSTKRVINYMAKKEYFDGPFAWFFKSAGCIPVDRQRKDEDAKKTALEVLNSGGALGIFPEGTRNRTDKLLIDFKFGAVSLASKTNSTIVPIGIKGDYKFRSKNLVVTIGEPFKIDNMDLKDANDLLRKKIEELLK